MWSIQDTEAIGWKIVPWKISDAIYNITLYNILCKKLPRAEVSLALTQGNLVSSKLFLYSFCFYVSDWLPFNTTELFDLGTIPQR